MNDAEKQLINVCDTVCKYGSMNLNISVHTMTSSVVGALQYFTVPREHIQSQRCLEASSSVPHRPRQRTGYPSTGVSDCPFTAGQTAQLKSGFSIFTSYNTSIFMDISKPFMSCETVQSNRLLTVCCTFISSCELSYNSRSNCICSIINAPCLKLETFWAAFSKIA